MKAHNGFTLMELMIVLVVIGIMAGAAVPAYQGIVEKSRSNEAITNLQVLYMAEKAYALDHSGNFFFPDPKDDLNAINTNLKLDVQTKFYDIQISGSGSNFEVAANRSGGGASLTIDQRGCFGGSPAEYVPENNVSCKS